MAVAFAPTAPMAPPIPPQLIPGTPQHEAFLATNRQVAQELTSLFNRFFNREADSSSSLSNQSQVSPNQGTTSRANWMVSGSVKAEIDKLRNDPSSYSLVSRLNKTANEEGGVTQLKKEVDYLATRLAKEKMPELQRMYTAELVVTADIYSQAVAKANRLNAPDMGPPVHANPGIAGNEPRIRKEEFPARTENELNKLTFPAVPNRTNSTTLPAAEQPGKSNVMPGGGSQHQASREDNLYLREQDSSTQISSGSRRLREEGSFLDHKGREQTPSDVRQRYEGEDIWRNRSVGRKIEPRDSDKPSILYVDGPTYDYEMVKRGHRQGNRAGYMPSEHTVFVRDDKPTSMRELADFQEALPHEVKHSVGNGEYPAHISGIERKARFYQDKSENMKLASEVLEQARKRGGLTEPDISRIRELLPKSIELPINAKTDVKSEAFKSMQSDLSKAMKIGETVNANSADTIALHNIAANYSRQNYLAAVFGHLAEKGMYPDFDDGTYSKEFSKYLPGGAEFERLFSKDLAGLYPGDKFNMRDLRANSDITRGAVSPEEIGKAFAQHISEVDARSGRDIGRAWSMKFGKELMDKFEEIATEASQHKRGSSGFSFVKRMFGS